MHAHAVDPRLQRMRAEIEQSGETLLERDELNLLCRGEILDRHRWETVAEIAINEGWSFTFFPDDSVRFSKLPPLQLSAVP
jgi:hypothetical protein